MSISSNQREAIRLLADQIEDANSTDELLELLEQIVANCSEIISTILSNPALDELELTSDQILSTNEIS